MIQEHFFGFERDQLTILMVNQNGARLLDQRAFERRVIDEHCYYAVSGNTPDDLDGGADRIYGLTAGSDPVELKIKWLPSDDLTAAFQLVQVAEGVLVADPSQPYRPYRVNFTLPDC